MSRLARSNRVTPSHTRATQDNNPIRFEGRVVRQVRAWAQVSDLAGFQARCQAVVHQVDDLLQYVVEHPLTKDADLGFRPFQNLIPVIKLSRLFLNKLSRVSSDKPHPFSEVSPDELTILIKAIVRLPDKINTFINRMEDHFSRIGVVDSEKVFDILDHLQRPIKIVKHHLDHPESPQGLHLQYRRWIDVWNSHLCRAGCRASRPHATWKNDIHRSY
ncbi:uncharacterized protein PGTG_04438 [Puccinia graminis f. sp. tritici CRL 75-36-700-3]|uniref:Uncharacterized protein n=1 Tax=Puccinia graminis f. sp. tritici (strain CRL 75-36-700-3 / race SCCL) TaxID=418459 RepID=E3K2B3_PUCGT|nr:uncharacterized protein PGTG_04438 [Puccinia graminis f. sp. tritici CRL 75-36-700-3]EFP78482.1 hypothetical protein PGTG_04438 [Puccinia graminis f. sp. tritici CRL 75-36-700-3]